MRTLLSGERSAMARARVRHDIICQIQDGDGNWQDYSKWLVSGNWGESKDSPISTGSLALRRYGNYIGRVQVGGAYDRVIRLNMEQGAQNPGEIDYCEEPTELATDNGLEAGTGAGWSFSTNWAISNDGNARTGTWAAKHTAGVANTSAINPARIACVPGDVFYAEGWLKGVSTPDGSALVRIRWLDSGLSTLSVSSGNAVANDGVYHISSLIGTAPASAAFANIEFRIDTASTTGTWYGDDLVFRRYTAGTFRHPNGTVWTIPTTTRTATSFEPGSGAGAKQFIMFVGSDGTRFGNIPFGTNVTGDGWRQFLACVYVNGQWSYDDNSVSRPFTPNSNDCIIGRITQDNTFGISPGTFNSFINGQEAGWAGGGSNYGGNLAPLNQSGILNVNAAGSYSPAIDKGRRIRLYSAVIPTDQVVDSFTRANVTNSLSTTENAGLTWLQNDSNLGINANQAYCSAGGSGHSFGILQYTSDGVYQADIKLSGTAHRANVGLAVRELDVNNTLIISLCTGTGVNPIRLYKRDGGSFTSLVESATPALTPGNTYTLKVVLCGINIQIWLNGTKYLDYDLVGADQTHFLMGVGGGLWINTGGSDGTDDLGSRWDNYSFTPSLGGEAGAAVKLGALYMGGCYREVFTGRIDTLDWSQDPMQLTFSDQGCWLQDTQIESEQLFGTTGGQAVETAMQNIINTWPSGMGTPSLYVPVSPSWNIRTYTQQRNKIMDAIRDLALQIGWDVRYRYRATGDGGTPAVTSLTLYDPNRGNVTPVDSIAASEYTDVRALSFNIAGVRNATLLKYWPAGGTSGVTATATDAPSIAKYGRRYIELPSSKNIDSSTEANKFVNAVINDLADSGADQEIEMLYYWPIQLYDLLTFVANLVHYDVNQNWAVGSFEHRFQNGYITTTIQVSGRVIGAYAVWQKRLTGRPIDGIGNVDFGSTGIDNKDVDHVGQGNTYTTDAQNTGADNLAENGNFEATAMDKDPVPGWTNSNASILLDTSAPYSGSKSLRVDASGQFGAAISRKRFKVTPGDWYKVSGRMKCGSISDQADVQLMFLDASGTYVSGVQAVTSTGQTTWSASPQVAYGQVPVGAVYGQISLQNNRAGAGTVYFDDILIVRVRSFDDEVDDGTTWSKEPTQVGADNCADNGNFEASPTVDFMTGYPPGWKLYSAAASTVTYETGTPYSGAQTFKMVGATNGFGAMSIRKFKCSAGEQWKVSAVMKVGSGTARVSIVFRNAAGSALGEIFADVTDTNYQAAGATGYVPAGAVYCTIHLYMPVAGTGYWDDVVCLRTRKGNEVNSSITGGALGIRPNTLACFTYEENAGLFTSDHSPAGVDLVLDSSAGWATDIGSSGTYVYGNSDSRYSNASHPTAHDVGGGQDFTVDFVVRYDGVSSVNTDTYIVTHENDYELAFNHSSLLWIATHDHWAANFPGIDFTPYVGRWTHVKWTYTSSTSTSRFYIDGILVATHVDTGSAGGTLGDILKVGHRSTIGSGSALNGCLAYLRVVKAIALDFPFLDRALALRGSTSTDPNGNVKSGILPTVGILEGSSSYKLYRHREDVLINGPDTDGDVAYTFANVYQNAPMVAFRGGQFVSFSNTIGTAVKQKQRVQVINLTASGFTSRAQIISSGATTARADDFPSGNTTSTVGGTAVATVTNAPANDNSYSAQYYVQVVVDANATNFCTATVTIAIDTDDGSGYVERAAFGYSASPLSGPPPYGSATTTNASESHAVIVTGLTATSHVRVRVKSFVVTNGGTGSFTLRGADGAGTNPETARGVTYNTAADTTESAIPGTGDQVSWTAQEVL
jgi:hypothetical protein